MRNGSHRFWLCIAGAVAVVAIAVTAASADFTTVNDPRGDTRCFDHRVPATNCPDSLKRNADIVSATAGHERGHLKHTIRVVGNAPQGVWLLINTDSDPGCEWRANVPHRPESGSGFAPCPGQPDAPPPFCCVRIHRHNGPNSRYSRHELAFTFKKTNRSPQSYGWRVETDAGPSVRAKDGVPNGGGYIQHRLGG